MYDRKCGYVYLIEFDHGVKIGRAKNPVLRTNALQTQSGKKCINLFISDHLMNCGKAEIEMHKHFKYARGIGEYFNESFQVILSKFIEMNFELAKEMTEKEVVDIENGFDGILGTFRESVMTREEQHKKFVEELDKWTPTISEIEFVKKEILDWHNAEKEEGMSEEADETLKFYNLVINSSGTKQRNLMQDFLISISNCTPREFLSKEFNTVSDRARGKCVDYLKIL